MKELIKKFIPSFLLDWYHFSLSYLGAVLYRFPSEKIKVIGVTGTNGKSTVVEIISRILEDYNPPATPPLASGERAPAGYKVASLSSIKFKIKEKEWPNTLKMTMPGRFKLQKFLRQAVDSGCQYVILEVTSEGIKQHRHRFINFDTAVFTNLTPEHIEAHGGFENYRTAKGKLFQLTKNTHVINVDDTNAEYFLQFSAKKKYTYGLNKGDINNKNLQLSLRLIGNFNIYNALAAICVGLSQGVDLKTCKRVVEKVEGIPGRMEEVISEPFKVFVDYAFTPNALEKVYQTLTNLKPKTYNLKPKLICVLGACGGGRDKWKRPVLGEIAAKYCDEIIVTNEDPYDENPLEIIKQVAKGTNNKAKKILDRREAIKEALKLAKEGDAVVITGKGCEPWICIAKGRKIPWDDRKVVKEEFTKKPMKYEILEHKADLKIKVFGETQEELFENAMVGMFKGAKYEPSFVKDAEGKMEGVKREIKISSLDLLSLLVDFLSEVLYLSEVNREVYQKIQFKKFTDKEIEGILSGKKLKRRGVIIKGVTYHDLDIKQRKDKIWEVTILFDI